MPLGLDFSLVTPNMQAKIMAIFSLLLFLTSCTVSMSRQEQVENILPTPSIDTSIATALQEKTFIPNGWPSSNWWEGYGLCELNQLIERALVCNPSIQAAQTRIAFAGSQAVIAHAKLRPLIYFDASDEWDYLSQTGLYRALNPTIALSNSIIDFSLSFFYEFDFWGKYRNRFQAEIGKQQAAIAETAQAQLIISTALAQAYFALQTNLVRKSLYEQFYQVRSNYFKLQTKLFHSALDSRLEPLLSQEDLFEAQQWLADIEQEIAVNRHVINVLAGKGPDEPLLCQQPLPLLPTTLSLPTDISIKLLRRRPDLMAQNWRIEALAHEVGAAKAEFLPDVNLVAFAGFQSGSWSTLFDWISKTVRVIPGLSLPIYTACAIQANVDAKKALFNEAVFEYNDLILKSFQQVADLLAIGHAVYDEKEKQTQIVTNSNLRYQLTSLRQQKGLDNALTTYQFREQMLQKELDDVQLLYEQYVVTIALIKALGGGYDCSVGT